MSRNVYKFFFFTLSLGTVFVLGVGYWHLQKPQETIVSESPQELFKPEIAPSENPPSEQPELTDIKVELPKEIVLTVPFTVQAPTANWDQLHDEACEEASAIMANAYFQNDRRSTLPPEEVEREIKKLTKWQQETFGYSLSINAEEMAQMLREVYGLKTEVVREFSEETIRESLVLGKLVIVPVNGRALGNPYFQPPGPIYHMFVIKGYKEGVFIINEPGTKRGQNYEYTYETIKGAVGDYSHKKKETDPERPVIIIVSK